MYRSHGFQDKDLLLETLVKDNTMTFFPEFNLLAVTSSPEPFHESMSRETAIFNVMASEISSGKFFEGFEYVSELVFDDGRDRAFAVFDSFEQDSDDAGWKDPRLLMLANLFSWSPTIDTGSISGMVDAVTYYQNHLLSDREGFEQSHGKPASEVHVGKSHSDAKELLDKLTSSETVSYFPEFNLLVTTTDYVPSGLRDRETAVFNVFPSELAYGKLFYGFENVADIPYSGPVIDPIAGWDVYRSWRWRSNRRSRPRQSGYAPVRQRRHQHAVRPRASRYDDGPFWHRACGTRLERRAGADGGGCPYRKDAYRSQH